MTPLLLEKTFAEVKNLSKARATGRTVNKLCRPPEWHSYLHFLNPPIPGLSEKPIHTVMSNKTQWRTPAQAIPTPGDSLFHANPLSILAACPPHINYGRTLGSRAETLGRNIFSKLHTLLSFVHYKILPLCPKLFASR